MSERIMVNMSVLADSQQREIMRALLRQQLDRQTAIAQLGGEDNLKSLIAQLRQTAQPLDPTRVNQPDATIESQTLDEESDEVMATRIDSFFNAVKDMLWDD